MKYFVMTALLASAVATTTPAGAMPLLFELTGGYTASWIMDSEPVPSDIGSFTSVFWDTVGNFPGSTFNVVDLYFYNAAGDGGLTIVDYTGSGGVRADTTGPQLFSGALTAPIFAPGTFDLAGFVSGDYVLTISAAGAIPEPAIWGMMIAGFGLVGATMRRRGYAATT